MSSYTRINIRINPSDPGVVVNTNALTATQISKKNSLYTTPQVPQKDKSQPRNSKNSRQKKQNQTVSTRPNKTRYQPSKQQVAEAERERDGVMREMREGKASTGMIYTSTQLLKQQNQLIQENQKIMHQLITENRNGNGNGNQKVNNRGNGNEKEQFKQATANVNNEIDEIRKMRDEIVRAGKEINDNLQDIRNGKVQIPNNISEMNQHLKSKIDTSMKNIDLLSPEKFDLVNKLQGFNIEGYSQKLNQLKKQINNMQRESQNVQKQLKARVNTLEKVRAAPNFQTQLLEPYQNDIKKRLGAIDLSQARKRVFEKLGEFDYFKLAAEVTDVGIQVQQELDQFEFVCKQYQISVPILKFDQKQIKALELKLPSILDQYKESRGIDFKKENGGKDKNKTGSMGEKEILKALKEEVKELKKNPIKNKPPIITKPKDLSNQIHFKNMGENNFKTIMQNKPNPSQKARKQLERNKIIDQSPSKKRQHEPDFEDYLNNIKNQQLEHLYKQKRDQLRRMKEELYEESTEPLEPYTMISYPHRQEESIRFDLNPPAISTNKKGNQNRNQNQNQTNNRIDESDYKQEDSIGSKIFDPNPGAIKQIGKQVLKEKLKDLIGRQNKPFGMTDQRTKSFTNVQANYQREPQMGPGVMNSFAEGFLTVINNTFSEMNRGISNSLSKRRPVPPRSQSPDPSHPKLKIPFPQLQEIPVPPKFNLKFEPILRQQQQIQQIPQQYTFSKFPKNDTNGRISPNQYDYLNDDDSYENLVQDRSEIGTELSKAISDDNSFV